MKKIFKKISDRPSRLIEWSQYWILAIVLLVTLRNLGGYLYFGLPMVVSMKVMMGLSVVYGLSWLIRRDKPKLHLLALLPLPFLFYAGISALWITPSPWLGELRWAVLLNAYLVYFIALHTIKSPKQIFYLMSILSGVVVVAIIAAMFQYYFFPEWFPIDNRLRLEQYGARAAGFFGIPNNFAGFVLLLLPFFAYGAFTKRLDGPMRVFMFILTSLAILGIVISASRGAFVGLLIQGLIWPLFIKTQFKERLRHYSYIVLLGGGILLSLWAIDANILERLEQAINEGGESTRPAMYEGAVDMFLDAPIIGQGIGSYSYLWDRFRPESPNISPRYAHNDYLEALAAYGLLGSLLIFIPVIYLLYKAICLFKNTPVYMLSKEGRTQLDRAKRGQSRRHSSDFDPYNFPGRVPSSRFLLGSILLGLIGFCAHVMVDFHLQIPVILYAVSILFAIITYLIDGAKIEVRNRRVIKICTGLLAPVIAFITFTLTAPKFVAEHYYYIGQEGLKVLLLKPEQIFDDPSKLYLFESYLENAVQLNEGHGSAYEQLSLAILARRYTEYESDEALGARAEPIARKAVRIASEHWLGYGNLAQALSFQSAGIDELLPLGEKVIQYAPNKPQGYTIMAALQLGQDRASEAGKSNLQRALDLDPGYRSAVELGKLYLNR